MILIVGREKAARQYVRERHMQPGDYAIASSRVTLHGRDRTVKAIIVVEGWSQIIDADVMAYLHLLIYRGAKWVSGVNS